ncbi:MAG: T9SS type A sorting domain-containing protein [Bacteroidota bacterium]
MKPNRYLHSLLLIFLVGPATQNVEVAWAQQKIIVERAAVLTWDEIVTIDGRPDFSKTESRAIHPPQVWPLDTAYRSPVQDVARPSDPSAPALPDATDDFPDVLDFEALPDNNGVYPPDTHGAAGPSHLMTMLNTQVRIQDKTGAVISTVFLGSFWSALNGDPFDPRLHYDAIHGRWLASCSSRSRVFFAISSSSDPTGSWSFYEFVADSTGAAWADFPRLGFNTNWIVLIASLGGSQGVVNKMWVIDQSTALSGGPLAVTIFFPSASFAGQTYHPVVYPCVTYGSEPVLYLLSQFGERPDSVQLLYLSRITGTGAAPEWSVAPGSDSAGTGSFPSGARFEGAAYAADQLGSSTVKIMTGGACAVFRNGQLWWLTVEGVMEEHNESTGRRAIFWFEIDPQAMPRPVVQSGAIDGGPGVFYYYPSIAVNALNDVCIGFSHSDASIYVRASYSGRLSTHPPGYMIPVQTLKLGEGFYWKSGGGDWLCRWGDYSNTCVDPQDDVTFWTIQEYAGVPVGSGNGSGRWGTRWGRIQPASDLPIQISSFSAVVRGERHVQLEWSTLSEINNLGFEVQKSTAPSHDYRTLPESFIPGHGTTLIPQYYSYHDTSAAAGVWYYRLKQIDLDGSVHYSQAIRVEVLTAVSDLSVPLEFALHQNYPNPFNASTLVRYQLPMVSMVRLSVIDILGREVAVLADERHAAGVHEVRFDAKGLSSGVYFYRFVAGDFVQTRRLLLLR